MQIGKYFHIKYWLNFFSVWVSSSFRSYTEKKRSGQSWWWRPSTLSSVNKWTSSDRREVKALKLMRSSDIYFSHSEEIFIHSLYHYSNSRKVHKTRDYFDWNKIKSKIKNTARLRRKQTRDSDFCWKRNSNDTNNLCNHSWCRRGGSIPDRTSETFFFSKERLWFNCFTSRRIRCVSVREGPQEPKGEMRLSRRQRHRAPC